MRTDRRRFVLAALLAPLLRAEERDRSGGSTSVRGRLEQPAGRPPDVLTAAGQRVELEGDEASEAVMRDARLRGEDFEASGRPAGPGRFRADPIYYRALFVWRDGKRLVITYWCPVCAIRSWSPGPCACCQNETQLDPRDPALEDMAQAN